MKSHNKPSELIFMVLIFVIATQTNEWRCACTYCTHTMQQCSTMCYIRLGASATTVRCFYCLAKIGFYRISAKLVHSCWNSIDTAVLDYSCLLRGCEGEIRTALSFWPSGASFSSLFTSARMFGAIVPDRGPLQSSMPSVGRL